MDVGISENSSDFSFGFDDAAYSDRILLLKIVDNAETITAPRVESKTIHINSLILAARSTFFRKLFSNGMREFGPKLVTLQIETSEEVSLMDLLKYVYNNNNLPTTLRSLLDLLVIADKFEVASCLRDCTQSLQNMSMTCELASLYLDLPSNLLMSPIVQQLVDAAKKFLIARFKNFDKCKEDMLNLSLSGIQVVISSNDLHVTSEAIVYNSVLTWARKHYPYLEERRRILKTHLLDLVRFPFMTIPQLTEEVQRCNDIDPELASQIVIRALSFKAETPHRKYCLATKETGVVSHQFVERAYKYRETKIEVVELEVESPHQHCMVFLNLTRKELRCIFPDGEIVSESFRLGKQEVALVGKCYFDKITNTHYFRLGLKVLVGSTASCSVKCVIAVRKKPSEEFVGWAEKSYTFNEQVKDVYFVSALWTNLMRHRCPYFINDVLHVRAELRVGFKGGVGGRSPYLDFDFLI